ncbi:hypothetical protein GTH52_02935 [Clostridium tyrobutyricum]|uniref:HTH cro/C1-type domain-containing protein n=1 Tax=Clostridium tyrobutyricum DIVETGP TaxID=1408889 RepID=W6N4I4_CLOTY|nr:hypothetical protein [Clostridium tyrobutyricum]AND85188.1 hypothetical protein CTK_C19360 [Clostridium tyrobutyricum]ANP69746.1 hypothetical protein BA182_08680 [Clostridium tyrobutyricum]MBV4432893.1 hypothetical protein [Clostridium tyrobutyricum]QCH27171.1 hypothetical protein EZN00_00765 [Clostridium tyrobutyricum]QNB65889.1 hypothetical protein GTH52_02935 [Clostridium tyrobutyricum]
MFVGDIKEKLLIFKARTGLTQNEICEEIGITPQRFSTVLNSEKSFSVKTEEEIRLMFLRYNFMEALDFKGGL